jgi:hypothetical protein
MRPFPSDTGEVLVKGKMVSSAEVLNPISDRLEIIADWRDQIERHVNRARLIDELGLLNSAAIQSMEDRVWMFCEAAEALSLAIKGKRQ